MDQNTNNPIPKPTPAQAPIPRSIPPVTAPIPTAPQHPNSTPPLTIIAVILGGLSILISLSIMGAIFGVAAIVVSIIALLKKLDGKKLAFAGLITGIIGTIISIGFIVLVATHVIVLPTIGTTAQVAEKESPADIRSRELIKSQKTFTKGETARMGYFDVKANNVGEPFDHATADEGNQYIFINLTVTNKDTVSHHLPAIKLSVDGRAYDNTFLDAFLKVPSYEMQPGQTVTGNMRYQIKAGGTRMKLQLTEDYINNPDTDDGKAARLVWTLAL